MSFLSGLTGGGSGGESLTPGAAPHVPKRSDDKTIASIYSRLRAVTRKSSVSRQLLATGSQTTGGLSAPAPSRSYSARLFSGTSGTGSM